MMGAYFVATGVSQFLGSVVANLARMSSGNLDPLQSLPMYTQLFFGPGWLAAGGAFVAVVLLPMLGRLSREHQPCVDAARDDDQRFALGNPALAS
ncbi:amino acid/peptide transporter [Caballeronia humi]|uniref:Amino acid/peptide transporter n=1 Tax=Caballeronia humi TaxID=326474 RepID=A0A158HWX7_9BURK|nr:amino acid/peptide transporter [Caballeronia humi]